MFEIQTPLKTFTQMLIFLGYVEFLRSHLVLFWSREAKFYRAHLKETHTQTLLVLVQYS